MHLYQKPNGSWVAVVQHDGQRRKITAKTKRAAQFAAAQALIELGDRPPTDPTIEELLALWFDAADLSITYRTDAGRVAEKLPATFTARPLSAVTPLVIAALYKTLERDGWTVHRIRRAHTVLSSAYSFAMSMEITDRNPFAAARKPAPPGRKVQPPTREQVGRLLAADGKLGLFLTVAATIGARRGETVALQWADVQPEGIVIRRSLSYAPGHGVVATAGKTGSKGWRTVAIDPTLIAELRAERARQIAETVAMDGSGIPLWIFSDDAGQTPWRPDHPSRLFRQLRDRLGTSILIITHDLGVIADVADRVVVMYAGRVVESADVDQLFAGPQHHYTAGLLSASPTPGRHAGTERLKEIPGLVPVLRTQPDACTFADRCPAADAQCREKAPPLAASGQPPSESGRQALSPEVVARIR